MQALSFHHSDGPSGLLRMGYAVCDYLSYPGATGTDAARIIYINTGWDVDRTEARPVRHRLGRSTLLTSRECPWLCLFSGPVRPTRLGLPCRP